ncbi:ubiquitin carboxyl-terminal hydrolase 20-like [Protopterus annectens]|uniref:ubiquitin carboxyl-terminal hydrolase 20-like n=1 Tax=Protopterus annectens TaxID=7888 RepID=UPI001CFB9FB0|nr:ubiquitin carboxyl-terminal hydrolase 20-like [Protopterus annectens]
MKQQDIADCFRLLLNELDIKKSSEYNKIFQSRVVNILECEDCHNTDELVQDFSVITLPVKPHLAESLDEFCKPTTLEGQNEVYCNKCCKKTATEMTYTFKCLPSVLVIQLKRFMQYRYVFEKDSSTIDIPLQLEIPYGNSKDKRTNENYSLYALCNHFGGVNSGHYNAVIKCSEHWNEFNDKYCYPSCIQGNKSGCISSKNAYLLFYQKDGKVDANECGQPPEKMHNEGTGDECKQLKEKGYHTQAKRSDLSVAKTATNRQVSTSHSQQLSTLRKPTMDVTGDLSSVSYRTNDYSRSTVRHTIKDYTRDRSSATYRTSNSLPSTSRQTIKEYISDLSCTAYRTSDYSPSALKSTTKDCRGDLSFSTDRNNEFSSLWMKKMPTVPSSKCIQKQQRVEPLFEAAHGYTSSAFVNSQSIVDLKNTSKSEARIGKQLRKIKNPIVKSDFSKL